jgi:hypothetical protein
MWQYVSRSELVTQWIVDWQLQTRGVRLKVPIFALMAIASVANCDAMTYSEYKHLKTISRDSSDFYLKGVGDGYLSMNADMDRVKRPKIYCPPPKLAIGLKIYEQVLEDEVAEFGEKKALPYPVEIFLLKGLKSVFPCD